MQQCSQCVVDCGTTQLANPSRRSLISLLTYRSPTAFTVSAIEWATLATTCGRFGYDLVVDFNQCARAIKDIKILWNWQALVANGVGFVGKMSIMSFFRRFLFVASISAGAGLLVLDSAYGDDLRLFGLDSPIISTLEDAPADMALVTTAIVARMRGSETKTNPVVFAPRLANRLLEKTFRYDGFHVDVITISFIGPANSWEAGRRLYGTILFTDELGRRAATSFGVEYLFDDGEIYVSDVALDVVSPPEPEVRIFLLPAEKASQMFGGAVPSHLDLLAFIAEHALDVSLATGTCSCVVAVVSMDRTPANASLYANVSDVRDGSKIVLGAHYLMEFEGWRVALLEGEIDLGSDSIMDIQALYAPPTTNDAEPTRLSLATHFIPGGDRK